MIFLILFFILALLAEVLGTVGGFGSSLFFVPIASFFFDFHSVLGITALFHIASNISKIAIFKNGFDKKLILNIGLPSILFTIIGAYLSKHFNSKYLEVFLAIFLLVLSSLFLFFKKIIIKPNSINSIGGGVLSGFLAGILGTGGAIRGLTLAAFSIEKNVFIATSAFIDLGVDLTRSVVYFNNGYIHNHDLYLIPILVLVSIVGTYLGKNILKHFSQEKFKKIVLMLILIVGIITLLKQIL